MSIFVNKELRDLIPPLSEEEYAQLEANIVAEGIRDPLVVWKQPDGREMLIDGHNRWSIAAHHSGLTFEVVYKDFKDLDEAKVWIIQNQLGRRNLNLLDEQMLRQIEHEITSAQAKERHGYRSDLYGDFKEKFPESGKQTRDIIGEKMGISGKQYDKLKAINEKATDRTKQLVREGKLSINQAYNSVHQKRPDPVKEMVKEAKENHEKFLEEKKTHTVDFVKAQEDKKNQSIIHNDLLIEIYKMLEKIENFGFNHKPAELDGLADVMDETERTALMDRFEKCDGILTKVQIAFIKN